MKRLLILSLTCLVLASCSKEQATREGIPMRVDPSLDGTKASITTETLQEFWLNVVCPADDKYSYLAEFHKENDKWDVASRLFWKDENASVDYCAASFGGHAFTKEEFAGSVDLAVPADQSSQEKLNSADLLTLKKTTVSYKDTKEGILPVKFSHGLAKLSISVTLTNVYYEAGWGRTLSPISSIKMNGANLGFSFQPATGTVTLKENTQADVIPMLSSYKASTAQNKNGIAVYEVLLPAQTIKQGDLKIEFQIGSGDYYWKSLGDIQLEAGKNQTLYVIAAKIPPYNGTIGGHEYVEMGHGFKWATCNIGATNPQDVGSYFAWGETEPKATYTEDNYKWLKDGVLTRYTGSDYDRLLPEDDAATVNWGTPWRIPTLEECEILMNRDEYTLEYFWNYNNTGVEGWLVTCKIEPYVGNYVFFPATSYYGATSWNTRYGFFWTTTLLDDRNWAWTNFFFSVTNRDFELKRYIGSSVRAVAN